MSGDRFVVSNKQSLDFYIDFVTKQFEESGYTTYSYVKGKQRTSVQSNALHKYCGDLAKALNDSGQDMRMVKDDVELPWTKETVKELLWKLSSIWSNVRRKSFRGQRKQLRSYYGSLSRKR